jgi:methionyl-tRNA formyltransferase
VKVAIVTPGGSPQGQHLCAEVAERHELVGVLHPQPRPSGGARGKLKRIRREAADFGVPYELLRLAAAAPGGVAGWKQSQAAGLSSELFRDAAARYEAQAARLAQSVADVNAPESVEWLAASGADVGICLGGPIYRAPLIESVPLMLNFHSGVSPLYNGTSTIAFAFANGHPHLCGGTLMVMNTAVDGGDLLGHYLPSVERDDDPATLFAKTVHGAAEIALRFLDHLQEAGSFVRCPQPRALFSYRGSDWTVDQGQRVRRLLAAGIPEELLRAEPRIEPYWDAEDAAAAAARARAVLAGLLPLP